MNVFETTLIQVANAVQVVWGFLIAALTWVGRTLEAILQPVLHPLLGILNPVCTAIGNVVFGVLEYMPPLVGLLIISTAAGVVMLIAFRFLSNQAGIARAKDDIKANLLALKLFKDDLRVAVRAQVRILWALLRLQRYILVPVLWMALPTMLLLSQMAMRYQWRPLGLGDQFLFTIRADSVAELRNSLSVEFPSGVEVEAGPIADNDDISWRLRARERGRHLVQVGASSTSVRKELFVGDPVQGVSPMLPDARWTLRLLYPIEGYIPTELARPGQIQAIEVAYPVLKSKTYGSDYWVITFFVASMVAAMLLKPLFKVRF